MKHYVITGSGYTEKKNVKIKFAVYFDEEYFEWQEVYENNKKLSEEELEEYQIYVEENMWFFQRESVYLEKKNLVKVLLFLLETPYELKFCKIQ
ncbi:MULTISPECIES: hypothetical protein [Bacillus]|nr:hypothetical protein [Bacillus mobilis]